jgi:XTP/dITP diphosphohydrolase
MSSRYIELATANAHKLREYQELFPGVELVMGLARQHEENGESFWANALIKARAYWRGNPVLADDSGLCVLALGGEPGVFSARFGEVEAGRPLTDAEKNDLLLRKLEGVHERSAYYVCALVLLWEPERFVGVQETWEGTILGSPRGTGGFGYDPIFLPQGETRSSAELSSSEKNRLSHRGKAARKIETFLREVI